MPHHRVATLSFLLTSLLSFAATPAAPDLATVSRQLAHEITTHGKAYANLRELTQIGPRLSGSANAARAVQWARAKLDSYGLDRVWLQPMSAPRWERGAVERATALSATGPVTLAVTALGTSVGTNGKPLEAEVVEVRNLDEVTQLGEAVRGKIVFYNRPMDRSLPDTFDAYDRAVDQRTAGPAQAAKLGAVAALVRTMTTLPDDDHPHTGVTAFHDGTPLIPAAAISTHGANTLSQLLKKQPGIKVRLTLSAKRLTPVTSYNVIGEIKGSELPNEYVVVSGHLDSWDLATGAQDDGPGVVQSIDVLRSFKALGLHPKRTVRAVLYMSEEFGGMGGQEYAKQAQAHGEKHVGALESDRGGFAPVGFEVDGDDASLKMAQGWAGYLRDAHAGRITVGFSGTDVEPLDKLGVPTFGFVPESRHYFDYHHSSLDRIEVVNEKDLKEGAAAMAIFTYLLSENGVPTAQSR